MNMGCIDGEMIMFLNDFFFQVMQAMQVLVVEKAPGMTMRKAERRTKRNAASSLK